MIESVKIPENAVFSHVWQNAENQALYFSLGEMLFLARLGNTPQGAALFLVDSLPESAVEQELPPGYAGAELRRVVVAWPEEEKDERLAIVLDLGHSRCLYLTLRDENDSADSWSPATGCGEVEVEIRLAARFPQHVAVPEEVCRQVRKWQRVLLGGVALFISALICLSALGELVGVPMVVVAVLGMLGGYYRMKRLYECPWCGAKELRFQEMYSMFCDFCHNSCTMPKK